jgi:integrase
MRLTILLGRRISEIAGAKRGDVHLSGEIPYVIIPVDREGNKAKVEDAVPLPPLAVAIIQEALQVGEVTEPLFVGATSRSTTSKRLTKARREWGWPGQVRLHDMRTFVNSHMALMGAPRELRSRTLHHTADLQQLVNTTYSSFDHMPERLKALTLWEGRLLEIVNNEPLEVIDGKPTSRFKWM